MSLAFALVGQGSTRRALRQADLATRVTGVSDRGALHLQHAIILERLGRLDEALDGYRRALASFRRSGDRNGEARALCDRGVLQTYRGALGGGGGRPAPVRRALRAARPRRDGGRRAARTSASSPPSAATSRSRSSSTSAPS